MTRETKETRDLAAPQPSPAATQEEEEPIDSVPLYRRGKIVLPLIIVLTLAAIGSWYWYVGEREYVSTDDAYIDGDRATVSAKMLGRIVELTVDEGDTVTAGQLLARLDDRDLKAQEAQAQASLKLAEENVKLAVVNSQKATDDFHRAEVQFREKIIPREQFDHTRNEFEASRVRQSVALAQVTTARAQLGIIETTLQNTTILAPLTGVGSKRWVLSGDVVQPAQPILSVSDLKNVWVTANVEETNVSVLRPGQLVDISVDAYPDKTFTGRVLQIGTNTASQFSLIPPNNASGNFTKVTQRVAIKLSVVPDAASKGVGHADLLPGMSVEVRVKVR